MSRRVTAAVGAAALLAVALPALPALASAASTASLAGADTEVLPGGTNVFDLVVTNSEASSLLSRGRTVNAIRVLLPSEIGIRTTADAIAVPGWTVRRTSTTTGLERYDLTPAAGSAGLAPGASLALPLPASVARPLNGDRTAAFSVAVSSDAGGTYQTAAGSLSTTIRTLKVTAVTVANDTVGGVLQDVADGSATAGQRILTKVTVQNFATNGQSVTPALSSQGGTTPADAVEATGPATVPGFTAGAPGSTVFTVPVKLGEVTADTARTFTGTATSAASRATTPAYTASYLNYAVQAAPTLTLSSFRPAAGNGSAALDFATTATKVGTPALRLASGDGSTLVLRSRTDSTRSSAPIQLKDTESFGTGTAQQDLEFLSTQLSSTLLADGRYDALYALTGTDGNGAPLLPAQRSKTLADVFNFDNAIPTVNLDVALPTDLDGDRTTAARNYDGSNAITVTATGSDTGGAPTLREIVLSCKLGASKTFAPTGTPTESVSGTTRTVTASFQVADFAGCLQFETKAVFRDAALNTGERIGSVISVDNTVPSLDTRTRGLRGAVGRFDGVDAAKASVMVNIDDNVLSSGAATSGVIGGCDPRAYAVDGQLLVQGVYVLQDGAFRECTVGVMNARSTAKPANNARYLRLSSDIARGGALPQPSVTYTPRTGLGADRVKDAAGNYAASAVQDTLNRLVPDAPVLIDVKRATTGQAGGPETAYSDGTSYFTRFSGTDLKVTVAGGLAGDVLQLVDAAGDQIGGDVATLDGGGTVAVPVAGTEGTVQRFGVRFKSPAEVVGSVAAFTVVFDDTLPTAVRTARGSGSTATVDFAEPVIGSNAASNWNAFELVEGEDGTPVRAFRGVSSVAGSGTARTITADFTDAAAYGGALYEYLDSARYEDYAGNDLAASTLVLK